MGVIFSHKRVADQEKISQMRQVSEAYLYLLKMV